MVEGGRYVVSLWIADHGDLPVCPRYSITAKLKCSGWRLENVALGAANPQLCE